MHEWILLKESIALWLGIDRGALSVLASLGLCLLIAGVSRRPIATGLPWLIVLLIELANEAATGFADGLFSSVELLHAGRDLLVFMAVPTALVLLGRFSPQTISSEYDRRIFVPAVWEKRAPVVEAKFRES